MKANPKISKVSKLDGIRSWSLQARKTCPGSVDKNGELVPACQGCYASYGFYVFPSVKEPRLHNREDWKNGDWVEVMVEKLSKFKYFRWFDSGDVYSEKLAKKIYLVMLLTPNTKHWLPTRSYKIPRIKAWLDFMNNLPNVVVRFSSDAIDGTFVNGLHGSTIIPHEDINTNVRGNLNKSNNISICEAYSEENNGKCNGCRKCWSKDVPVIGYVAHGVVMKKIIKERVK